MRSSKSRSRSKTNRPRTVGNIVNRVFDSSGPEGKVRGTPQQIIEKYLFLARDAQLSNDRVAAENFLQHAEHYTRMLGEAQRELAAEMEARPPQPQQNYQGGQNGQNGQPREGYRDQQPRDPQPYRDQSRDQQQPRDQQPREQQPREAYRDQQRDQQPRREDREYRAADYARDNSIDDQPYTRRTEMIDQVDEETGLVETPESRARMVQRRASEEASEPRQDAPRQDQQPRQDRKDRPDRRPDRRPRRDDAQPAVPEVVETVAAPVEAPVQAVSEQAPPVSIDAPAPKPRAPRKPKVAKPEGDATPPDGPREAAE